MFKNTWYIPFVVVCNSLLYNQISRHRLAILLYVFSYRLYCQCYGMFCIITFEMIFMFCIIARAHNIILLLFTMPNMCNRWKYGTSQFAWNVSSDQGILHYAIQVLPYTDLSSCALPNSRTGKSGCLNAWIIRAIQHEVCVFLRMLPACISLV